MTAGRARQAGLLLIAAGWVLISCIGMARADERILGFSSHITVTEDASLTIRETIKVHADQSARVEDFARKYSTTHRVLLDKQIRKNFDDQSIERAGRRKSPELMFRDDSNRPAQYAAGLGTLLVLGYYLFVWFKFGRSPDPGTIIPLHLPPKGVSPAGARFLTNMEFDAKTFTAAVVSLAVKGALTIENNGEEFVLRRLYDGVGELSKGEKEVVRELFAAGLRTRLPINAKNHATFSLAEEALKKALKNEFGAAYFVNNWVYLVIGLALSAFVITSIIVQYPTPIPLAKWIVWSALVAGMFTVGWYEAIKFAVGLVAGQDARYMGVATFVLAALSSVPFMTLVATGESFDPTEIFPLHFLICLAALFAVNFLFYFLLRVPTNAGARLLKKVEGFRQFLSIAETERLSILYPPEVIPEVFEKYLPYALALDVEIDWNRKFSRHLSAASSSQNEYVPVWYTGGRWSLADGLKVLTDTFVGASSAAAPSRNARGDGG